MIEMPAATISGAAMAETRRMIRERVVGFMLAHEQFPVPALIEIGEAAAKAGFPLLATSDHFQPWQANEGHSGLAWVTLAALGYRTGQAWMGTTVTCPLFRYNPAVVAEAFASLSLLYPGRIFLGLGSGEELNETAATGLWPDWQERWDRLIEAVGLIRELWTGETVRRRGRFYTVEARLYDTPAKAIPILLAANGKKSMRLAGRHGDGLITDPITWKSHKAEWEAGVRESGRDPADLAVLVEQYVVVGGAREAEEAATLWRFGPKAFEGYYDDPDPASIERRAAAELSLETVTEGWPIATEAAPHVETIRALFSSGATIVNIHAGQHDQRHVIDLYGHEVLPALGL
jgi:TAT-translocated FGD2 family F420-dependent dehydrogenase